MDNKERIRKWLANGKQRRSSHVIITYDRSKKDFRPVYVKNSQDVRRKLQEINNNINVQPLELYNLSKDMEGQLRQARAWNE